MRLVFQKYGIDIEFKENCINILTIENQTACSEILRDLWEQYNGAIGTSILSDVDIELKISKVVECIYNIYDIDCNDKKILSKVYQDIFHIAEETFIEKTSALNKSIVEYIDQISQPLSYSISQSLEMDVSGLLKLYNVKISYEEGSITEMIIEYVRLIHRILNKQLFVFVNLKQLLTDEELQSFYEFVFYEKVYVLIVEGNEMESSKHEQHLVIDKDLCLIQY